MKLTKPWFGWLLLALACTAARAHDPLDLTSQARLLPDGIELRLTIASSTAHRLLTENRSSTDMTADDFRRLAAELERRAPDFLTVRAGGEMLRPKISSTQLSDDGDVIIVYRYPPSNASSFEVRAALLQKLPDRGYTLFLLALGTTEDQASHGRMTQEQPICSIAAFTK